MKYQFKKKPNSKLSYVDFCIKTRHAPIHNSIKILNRKFVTHRNFQAKLLSLENAYKYIKQRDKSVHIKNNIYIFYI